MVHESDIRLSNETCRAWVRGGGEGGRARERGCRLLEFTIKATHKNMGVSYFELPDGNIFKTYENRQGSRVCSREWNKRGKKEKKEREVYLPGRCSPGCPECAAIDRNHGHPPSTVYLSPIRCTSASTEIGTSSASKRKKAQRLSCIGQYRASRCARTTTEIPRERILLR